MNMRYYLAPLEGITRYVYRNAYHKYFTPMDKYFAPFLAPTQTCTFRHRELSDILPENNRGLNLVPQILTNRTDGFLWAVRELRGMGYEEVNLNLGCPSRTVVSKKRGSGFLSEPEKLDAFLDEVFSNWDGEISIKTRLGINEPEEWGRLIEIYNQYPLSELIVHPRLQKDFYNGKPDMAAFGQALAESKHHLCYNGDIFVKEDLEKLLETFPQVDTVMLGRGILVNPGLLDTFAQAEAQTETRAETLTEAPTAMQEDGVLPERTILPDNKTLADFLADIEEGYSAIFDGETNVLFKLKELWCYMAFLFPEDNRYLKKIKKANRLSDYDAAVQALFEEMEPVTRRFLL